MILTYFTMAVMALACVRVAPWPLAVCALVCELGYQAFCFWCERRYAEPSEPKSDGSYGRYA